MIRIAAGLVLASVSAAAPAEFLLFDNGRLFVAAKVNGVATEALLDSGAEATLIDPVLAAKARLATGKPQQIHGSGGTSEARIVEGAAIEGLGQVIQPEAVIVMDLGELSRRLIKRPTQMILGRELFDAARLRIDIGAGQIEVVARTTEPRGTRLDLTPHAGIEAIPALLDDTHVLAEFDLGNGSGVLISRALASRLKLKVIGRRPGGGIGGAVARDLVQIPSLEVAGRRFSNVTAAIDDQSNAQDLNVGTSILKHFLITTDFQQRAVWLDPVAPATASR